MRQFDVFVWGSQFASSSSATIEPPFTDPALGWFFGNNINENLEKSDAEWIVFANETINIDRPFLNDLAQAIEGFPMVDAFAPRVNCTARNDQANENFIGGYLLQKWNGFQMISENDPVQMAKLKFVAAPNLHVVAFSKRIIQRTGFLDTSLSTEMGILDLSLRMLHAGGKMFSLPYLVTNKLKDTENTTAFDPSGKIYEDSVAYVLYKNFGFLKNIPFFMAHPSTLKNIWKNRKKLDEKRDAAILLSKLKPNYLKEISI